MSWPRGLQQKLKLLGVAALNEEAVGVVSIGQKDLGSRHALSPQAACYALRSSLAALVGIGVEGNINMARAIAQLLKLGCVGMIAQ
jgi:hypothetical protein